LKLSPDWFTFAALNEINTSALRERWQPTRGGLVNLFKYEDQVFRYENGHLLLRGNNGSGKSRVLALQLPFLLDGEILPSRVEPDRDAAKRMEWNLLMDRHERRTGYTWIEFGRCDGDGAEHWITLGCGLEARRGLGAPNRWFFMTSRRIGEDLTLLTEHRVPLGKKQLAIELGGRGAGQIFTKAREYRNAVDDALFKLGGRYRPLMDLLIQLRQPQLMRDMKEDQLSNALSEALPPVSEALIEQVAESFQGLDSDRRRTEAQREMLESVESFRDGYQQYLQVAVRRLCRVVREGHSQFEHAARKLRGIDLGLAENSQLLVAARSSVEEARGSLATLEAEIDTLRSSPEMRSRRELDLAVQQADERAEDARMAQAELGRAVEMLKTASAEREKSESVAAAIAAATETEHRRLTESHRELIATDGAGFFDLETASLAQQRKRIGEQVALRKKSLSHLEKCNREIADHEKKREKERDVRGRFQSEVVEADGKCSARQREFVRVIDDFGDAVARWERGLVEIGGDDFERGQSWAAKLAAWLDQRAGEFAFVTALNQVRDRVQEAIVTQRAVLSARRGELEIQRDEIADELADLREGRQLEPPPRYLRAERDADRAGAPFWKCFEFCESVPVSEHSGWEAALESAGLMDAWVLPDGSMISGEILDDFLGIEETGKIEESASLAVVLRVGDGGSPAHDALLRRIGNHRDSAPCWIDRDGYWANGPHFGSWTKPSAQYLGHRAREEARGQRIDQLDRQLRVLEEKLQAVAVGLEALATRTEALATELRVAPCMQMASEVAVRLEQDRELLADAKRRLVEAETRLVAATQALEKAVGRRDTDAADMRLAQWAEPDALAEFRDHLEVFERACLSFWPGWQRCIDLRAAFDRALQREAAAIESEGHLREANSDRQRLALRARSAADTLQASVGTSVSELMERLKVAESGAVETRGALRLVEKSTRDGEIERARLEAKQEDASEQRESAEESRNRAVGRMETFVAERLFEEIDPAFQPEKASFSPSAAVDLARRLEQELKGQADDEERWNRLQSGMAGSFNELADQLGRHGLLPQLSNVDEASVSVIRCEFQGQSRGVRELGAVLEDELAHHSRIFEEREREIIENHLIGEAAMQLQILIRKGEDWVVQVNKELQRVPTSSGMQLKFDWGVDLSEDDRLKPVRKLFLKTSAALTPGERDTIGTFLHERIRAEREQDDMVPWRQHLARALDYRAWHRFGILRRTGSNQEWKKLTKRVFGTGSGGEKALALTVPQFAAAAAHYNGAHRHAPRLILLDEVFVGIDQETRARLMGLLEVFDLDYVMTSESEWGTHPSVSALAIYQLASRQGFNAVAVTRWVWNGSEKVRDRSDDD
jgi:uncharacterized protein (TIGR02680 family)